MTFCRQEIEKDYYQGPDKKENILASVEMQYEWLRDVGFQDVDCFFKVFELALFGEGNHPTSMRLTQKMMGSITSC